MALHSHVLCTKHRDLIKCEKYLFSTRRGGNIEEMKNPLKVGRNGEPHLDIQIVEVEGDNPRCRVSGVISKRRHLYADPDGYMEGFSVPLKSFN